MGNESGKNGVEAGNKNGVSKRSGQEKDEQKTPTLPVKEENKEDDDDIEVLEVVDVPCATKKRRRSESNEVKKEDKDDESASPHSSALAQAHELAIAYKNLEVATKSRDEAVNSYQEILVKISKLERTSFENENLHKEEMEKAMKRIAELEEGQNKKCLEWIDKYQTELKKSTEAAKETERLKAELRKTKSALAQCEKDFDHLGKSQFDAQKVKVEPMCDMLKEAHEEQKVLAQSLDQYKGNVETLTFTLQAKESLLEEANKKKVQAVVDGGRFILENRQLKEQLEELQSVNAALCTMPPVFEQLVEAQKRIKELEDTIQSMKEETANAKNKEEFKWQKNPDAPKERRKNTRFENDQFNWQNPYSYGPLSHQNNSNYVGGTISTQHAPQNLSDIPMPFGAALPPHMIFPPPPGAMWFPPPFDRPPPFDGFFFPR